MHSRAAQLISSLALAPHPEGGHFREIYRSAATVAPQDARTARAALTTIYFLLTSGEVSRWHRVASDEVWCWYEGDPLELLVVDAGLREVVRTVIGPVGSDVRPVYVVRAHCWQAARPMGAYTLTGCTVGPGFEFCDFALLSDLPAERERFSTRHPDLVALL
jgi:predicted cupin superfamily sugar epimerase